MKQAMLEKIQKVYGYPMDEKGRLFENSMDGKIVFEMDTPEANIIEKHCEMLPVEVSVLTDNKEESFSTDGERFHKVMIAFELDNALILMDYGIFLDDNYIQGDVLFCKKNKVTNVDPAFLIESRTMQAHLGKKELGKFLVGLKEKLIQLYFGDEATENEVPVYYDGM